MRIQLEKKEKPTGSRHAFVTLPLTRQFRSEVPKLGNRGLLDLLGFRVETGPEYSGTISFYQRDDEITRILEQEQEHELLNFGI